ncbi:hypothetical protein IAD21_00674 [Abditibacteriota bacterium]|nr:hypothetical protein IAD21_00674 [Abditibacteriota bacterium]
MPDGRINNGGARAGAGRRSLKEEALLNDAIKKACPAQQREAIFTALTAKATKGDTTAARLILSYTYGTPPSGDDLAVEERVNAIAHEFFNRLAPIYGEKKAREILGLLATPGTPTRKATSRRLP